MPDVAEAVEEDEVAGLELVSGDRRAHAVLRGRVVRERDADLRVHVHDEAGAVEAGRARRRPRRTGRRGTASRSRRRRRSGTAAGPASRARTPGPLEESSAASGTDSGVGPGGRLRSRETRSRLRREPLLPQPLGRLEARDLALDRREHALPLGELALDRAPLLRLLGDDPRLRCPGARELLLAQLDLGAEARHVRRTRASWSETRSTASSRLSRSSSDCAPSSTSSVESLAAVDVERDEPGSEVRLRVPEARLRDHEVPCVRLQLGLDPVELARSRGCTTRPRARAARRSRGSARGRPAPGRAWPRFRAARPRRS